MVDKAILSGLSSSGLLPSALSGAAARPLMDFSRVNPISSIQEDIPNEEPEDEEPGFEEEKESHPETRIDNEELTMPTIQFDEEDMDLGSEDELLPAEIVQAVEEELPEAQRQGFIDRIQERVEEVRDMQNEINREVSDEIRQDESFERWLAREIFKGFITSLSMSKFIELSSEIYNAWESSPYRLGKEDGISNDPPPSDNFERTLYWSEHPVPPHCKRHIYTDKDGVLSSLLVCSDSSGTRTYHNR